MLQKDDASNHRRDGEMTTTASIAIIAIVAAVALLGVVVLTVTVAIPIQQQQAEARGCPVNTAAINASKGRCFNPR
jgi:hypothetical protein